MIRHYLLSKTCFCCIFLVGALALLTSCASVAPNTKKVPSFSDQKGNLPWPSEGEITESFGAVVNPIYGTKVNNPGILISTIGSTVVSSVYDGEVLDIVSMPEFGNVITISHGEYTTVYGNLSQLYVTKGVRVRAGEYIGHAGTENEPKGEAVFFALFQNGIEANPELWLKKQ